MGRKSTKGKEKKQKRKEEAAKIAAAQALVDAANKLEDPMASLLPFKKFDRNGLNLTLDCKNVTQLDQETKDWVFQLTKENMQDLYEKSETGWKEREKVEEMMDDRAWYIIVRMVDTNRPVALANFRFDLDEGLEVLYCYEIQLSKDVRRKGLGKFLMQVLELMAFKTQMKKVVLTVFKHNDAAQQFFVKTLKYEKDETSPEDDPLYEEFYDYEILSKDIAPRKPLAKVEQQTQKMSNLAVNGTQ